MASSETQPDEKFQFSLRTLLVSVLLVSVFLGVRSTPESMKTILYTCYIGIALTIGGLVYRRRWLIAVGVVAVAMSVPFHSFMSSWEYDWRSSVGRSVRVTVVDAKSNEPIPGASITLAHDGVNRYVTRDSDSGGTVTFDWAFFTSGKDCLLWKTGCIHVGWEEFRIKADGYSPCSLALNERTGKEIPLDSAIPPFTIALKRNAE